METFFVEKKLSLGRLITLIKSYLSILPVYYLSSMGMSVAIREELDLIRRDFFWEGRSEKKKSHLMRKNRT